MRKFCLGLAALGAGASLCIASQAPEIPGGSEAEPITGTLLARASEDVDWRAVAPGQVTQSGWLRTQAGGEAVVAFRNESHLRMAENTTVHVTSSNPANLNLEVTQGKILVDVPEHGRSQVRIETPKGGVSSSGGVMVVEASSGGTRVDALSGSPTVAAERLSLPGLGSMPGQTSIRVQPGLEVMMESGPVALEGPDVRRRNKKRGKFVQGEESGPKRVGEDESPSPSPSPNYTPPPTQPPPTVVTPPPPDTTPVITEGGGGGEIWPYLLGLGALGTGAYFLFRDDDSNNNGGFIVNNNIPASP